MARLAAAVKDRYSNRQPAQPRIAGWRFDLLSRKVFWSPEVYTVFGLPVGDGFPDLDWCISLYTPKCRVTVARAVDAAIQHGTPYDLHLDAFHGTLGTVRVHTTGAALYEGRIKTALAGTIAAAVQAVHARGGAR